MECPHCQENTSGVLESNFMWCTNCGAMISKQILFLPSYQNKHHAPRQQIYSRSKRFKKWLMELKMPVLLLNLHAILDIYSSFELAWVNNQDLTERTYFYAKPCMLKTCCDVLQIDADIPAIKDKNRQECQLDEMSRMKETLSFKLSRSRGQL